MNILKKIQKLNRFSKPILNLHQGRLHAHDRNYDKALKLWTEAQELSNKLDMKLVEALTFYEVGRFSRESEMRETNLEHALSIFRKIGAHHYVVRVTAAITFGMPPKGHKGISSTSKGTALVLLLLLLPVVVAAVVYSLIY